MKEPAEGAMEGAVEGARERRWTFFFADDATLIMVNLFIRSFAKIDDVKMEYSVQITFR